MSQVAKITNVAALAVLLTAIFAASTAALQLSNGGRVLRAPLFNSRNHHVRYRLIDLGTFGGPASYFSNGFDGIIDNAGTAIGSADTPVADPFCFNPDCFVSHAFAWHDGVLTDLGVLPGGLDSAPAWISTNGLITGISQDGKLDPEAPGLPEVRGVVFAGGIVTDIGSLPGGNSSFTSAINNRGQVVGVAFNGIPDPFSLFAPGLVTTQSRAFLWQNGSMGDLGTLGGSDAIADFINARGQVTGISYTNDTPNPLTGLPTVDPFLWQRGKMVDLGTLGGTFGAPTSMNNRGQVVGDSNLAGDHTGHPFVLEHGVLTDLGTLGGLNGITNWINDNGDIAGKADLPGPIPQNHDAVLWSHGVKIDLGVVPGDSCSNAYYVNARGQVVGTSESRSLCLIPTGEHAFLWQRGGTMVDLNSLIPDSSSLQLTFAFAINDRGEIVGVGTPPGCAFKDVERCGHAYVLLPCNGDNALEDCREEHVGALFAQPRRLSPARPVPSLGRIPWLRCRLGSCAGIGG